MIKINVIRFTNIKKLVILFIIIITIGFSIGRIPILTSSQKHWFNIKEQVVKDSIDSAFIYINGEKDYDYLDSIIKFFLIDNTISSDNIINSQVILLRRYSKVYKPKSIVAEQPKFQDNTNSSGEDNKENEVKIVRQIISSDKVTISNQTSFKVDIEKYKKEPLGFVLNNKLVNIIIYHTHTTESYTSSSRNYYLQNDYYRTSNLKYNVAGIGGELYNQLKKKRILSYHDKTVHDSPAYSGSYRRSLQTVTNDLNKYNQAKIALDIHRDSFGDGKQKLVAKINGKDAAQIMFVVGTNELGLKHDKWNENLKFAIKLQNALNSKYPNFCRPINLREERFNQHVAPGAIIVEVGCTGNTLEEAKLSMKYLAEGIATIMNK